MSCYCKNGIEVSIGEVYRLRSQGSGDRLPDYIGNYEITPKEVDQTIQTANKSMTRNVVVKGIEKLDDKLEKITTKNQVVNIDKGYHSGNETVTLDQYEAQKIVPSNIKAGVSILGITGNYAGEEKEMGGTATASDILQGKTAYVNNVEVVGTIPKNSKVATSISTKEQEVTINQGYYSEEGSVSISAAEQAKIIPENIKEGVSILGVRGTHAGVASTVPQGGNATADDLLQGKTAYVNGAEISGTIPIKNAISENISTKDQRITIEKGFHNGNGVVELNQQEAQKLVPENIKQGVTLFGVEGSFTGGENIRAQNKVVTPSDQQQIILPDAEYDYLSQVTVEAVNREAVLDEMIKEEVNEKGSTLIIG